MAIEVAKTSNESNASLLRRFSKRVSGAGVVRKVRGARFHLRTKSALKKKNDALKKLKKKADYERLFKLGKLKPKNDLGKKGK
jgi:ribosomal protein S21